nr:hypothetical protein [Micromonospora purpureochromogenes]
MALTGQLDVAGTVVAGDADLSGTAFVAATALGPITAGDGVSFEGAEFDKPARIVASSASLSLRDAIFKAGGVILVRHAVVTLDRAALDEPLTVAAYELEPEAESVPGVERLRDGRPRLVSMIQVDSANLSLVDVDLSRCRFAGAFHLDKLVMEGRCTFASQPPGWWRTRRCVIAEEIAYRALRRRPWQRLAADLGLAADTAQKPQRLASLYRQLRKAQEDVKNEPGAGDFYYAEMEMRRCDSTGRSAERLILFLHWLVGGVRTARLAPANCTERRSCAWCPRFPRLASYGGRTFASDGGRGAGLAVSSAVSYVCTAVSVYSAVFVCSSIFVRAAVVVRVAYGRRCDGDCGHCSPDRQNHMA